MIPEMEAPFPPELLGRRREDVKLLLIRKGDRDAVTTRFENIVDCINKGDVIVFNNSSLVRASIPVYFPEGDSYGQLHIGTSVSGDRQLVEIRPKELNLNTISGSRAELLGTVGTVEFPERHSAFRRFFWAKSADGRNLLEIAGEIGKVLRYDHIPFDIPEKYYKNETGIVPGSVEYPSAARPFTERILKRIKSKGAIVRGLTLHCNLGSLEPFEFENSGKLLDEQFSLPAVTANSVIQAKENGNRVIAVGTSVVRALESAVRQGKPEAGNYSTTLFIRGDYEFKAVNSIVTGMHEKQGSHIGMISAFAGTKLLESSYSKASRENFSWHEFGDLAFII